MIRLPLDIAKNANFDLLGFIRKRIGQVIEKEKEKEKNYG